MNISNLTFPHLSTGTHQSSHDFSILLYKGAASCSIKKVKLEIEEGKFGHLRKERISFVQKLHSFVDFVIQSGASRFSIDAYIDVIYRFFRWLDENSKIELSEESAIDIFYDWADWQKYRYTITKEISHSYGYRQVSKMANILSRVFEMPGAYPGYELLLNSGVKRPKNDKKQLGTEADKQIIENTLDFGAILKTIADTLTVERVRGPLPIKIALPYSKEIVLQGNLINPDLDIESLEDQSRRERAIKVRAAMLKEESLLDSFKRSAILNFRIEVEMLMFVAQTGMNITQAGKLRREGYRWKSSGEDLELYRVYKGRRQGDAVFRCFRVYREHFESYIDWLKGVGFDQYDSRLFPLQSRGMVKSSDTKIGLYTSRGIFKKAGLKFVNPSELRKTRVNWLLRNTDDIELTSQLMAHDSEVLLKHYERPHHQRAVVEILKFYSSQDGIKPSPGPGVCAGGEPLTAESSAKTLNLPPADCISSEGCLFCTQHRDIFDSDYCWKLASHAQLKRYELALYRNGNSALDHPVEHTLERINQKLQAISRKSESSKIWVDNAVDNVRAGRYHPDWREYIELMEEL